MKIDPKLAELIGIHIGDGYLRYKGFRKEFDVSGGYEEKDYYDNHVIPLVKSIFNLPIKGRYFPSRSTYGFVIRNRNAINTFIELEFPSGSKTLIVDIPKYILNNKNKEVSYKFLRGYFDTDGCLTFDKKIGNKNEFKKNKHFYPRFIFPTVSKNLHQSFIRLINKIGFLYNTYVCNPRIKGEHIKYITQLCGINNLNKWMSLIGIKNPSKLTRYKIWKKFGFCPTNTTYKQRKNILKGKLDINSVQGSVV